MEGQLDKCRGTGVKENFEHPQIQNPPQCSLVFQLQGNSQSPCSAGLAFLGRVQLGKCSKLNQKSSLRRGPVTSFAALFLKFQKGHSDNKKYTQFLVKLMSCCCPFRETLISSQRAGASLSRARGA